MDIISAIFTGLRSLIGAIIPSIKGKYFDQPKIYFDFKKQGGTKQSRGLSSVNDANQPIDTNAISLSELLWKYKMIFRNNSKYSAYNIRLLQPLTGHIFRIESKIELLKPILSNSESEHEVEFFECYEGIGQIATDKIRATPDFLLQEKFILEYSNIKGTKFYTEFDGKLEEALRNKFLKKLKKK